MTMADKIEHIITAIHSKRDRNGNVYWALRYTEAETGKQVEATISGGESNIRAISYHLNGGSHEPHSTYFDVVEMPIREFNRMTKAWPYGGCQPEALASYIRQQIATSN